MKSTNLIFDTIAKNITVRVLIFEMCTHTLVFFKVLIFFSKTK